MAYPFGHQNLIVVKYKPQISVKLNLARFAKLAAGEELHLPHNLTRSSTREQDCCVLTLVYAGLSIRTAGKSILAVAVAFDEGRCRRDGTQVRGRDLSDTAGLMPHRQLPRRHRIRPKSQSFGKDVV